MSPKLEGLEPGEEKAEKRGGLSGGLRREKGSGPATGGAGKLGQAAKTYVVQAGDTMAKIAQAVYGDASRWPEIFEANKDQVPNPDLIRVGQELRIP